MVATTRIANYCYILGISDIYPNCLSPFYYKSKSIWINCLTHKNMEAEEY